MINKIALAGCGNVGTALLEILHEKRNILKNKYNFVFEVTMVTDIIKGTIADPNGLDLGKILEALHEKNSLKNFKQKEGTFDEILLYSNATMLAEATPTNLKTGEPGLSFIRTALKNGISATMTNKGPIAIAMNELMALAKENDAQLKYEGVIMSGTPLINMISSGMTGCDIIKAEGILNGTTNFILTEMSEGMNFDEALATAQALGYAETDPTGDIEGWDPAVKIAILAKILYGIDINVNDVEREGITHITAEMIDKAKAEKSKIKLIASIHRDCNGEIHAKVAPTKISRSHPLASVDGITNAITLTSDNLGETTLIGAGAGRKETGQALLTDLIAMAK
ncbi:MAG: homoserine dehydrogenase [Synergistaceae bacterium]